MQKNADCGEWSRSKPEVEFQYGGRSFFKNGSSYISAVNWDMSTRFCFLLDFDHLKADTARLQAFLMKAQRRILNIKWYDFVTNDSVRSQTKLTDLPLIIADRRHSLLGHVCCLPPDVPAHNILQHCVDLSHGRCPAPDWKRPPGRPRNTWIQQVEEDHRCTIDSLWSSAQDHSLWRSQRPSLVKRSSQWVSVQKWVLG